MSVDVSTLVVEINSKPAVDGIKELGRAANATGVEGTRLGQHFETAAKSMSSRVSEMQKAFESAVKPHNDRATALQKEISELGKVGQENQKYMDLQKQLQAAQASATTAQYEFASSMENTIQAFERGKSLMEQYQTPQEQYERKLAEINNMLKQGAIDQQTYNRATADAKTALDGAGKSADSSALSLSKLTSIIGAGALAMKAYQLAVQGVATAQTNMMTTAKLHGVIATTGKESGITASQLSKLSQELQNTTIYSSTAIESAQALMGTFYTIGAETFPRAMQAAADMAAVTGSLESATLMLSKALDEPVDGLTALSRQGFRFSDAQKDMIKTMVESGNKLEAQSYILDAVEKSQRGVSAAIADTPAGKLQQLKNEYSNLQAELGLKLIPTLVTFQRTLNGLTDFIVNNMDVAVGAAVAGMAIFAPAVIAATKVIAAKTIAIYGLTSAMAINPLFAGAVVASVAAGIIVMRQFKDTMTGVTAVVGGLNSSMTTTRDRFDELTGSSRALIAELNKVEEPEYLKKIRETSASVDAEIEKLQKRIAELKSNMSEDSIMTVTIRTVGDVTAGMTDLQEIELHEKAITDLRRGEAKNRNRIMADAGKEEREARAAALREMQDQAMTAAERELRDIDEKYKERVKLFKGNAEQLRQLEVWRYEESEKIISAETNAIAEEERKREQLVRDRVAAIAEIESSWQQKLLQQSGNRLAILAAERDATIAAELEKMSKLEMAEEDTQKVIANIKGYYAKEAETAQRAERDKFMGVLMSGNEKVIATYQARQAEILASTALTEQERSRLVLHTNQEMYRQLEELAQRRKEQERRDYEEMIQLPMAWGDAVVSSINSVAAASSALSAKRMHEVDAQSRREIKAIEASTMSEERKADAIKMIEAEAAQVKHSAAMQQWRLDKTLAVVNSAAAIIKTMASTPYPFNIPLAAAQAVAGGAQLAIIEANKPTLEGFWEGGRIPSGGLGMTQEFGPEIIRGPATVTSGNATAQLFDDLSGRVNNLEASSTSAAPSEVHITLDVSNANGDIVRILEDKVRSGEARNLTINMGEEMVRSGTVASGATGGRR